jgi:hypothetical protein
VFEAMLRANKLPAPCYGFRFHAERKWRFDMAFPDHRIALEVDGGIWRKGGGAHSHPSEHPPRHGKDQRRPARRLEGASVHARATARAIDDLKLCLGGP